MLNEITILIDYINTIIENYPMVFHALVPIGTVLTAILGIKNTNHIKTQANIQREIESNRFNIELFEHRLSAYNEFKNNIKGKDIYEYHYIEEMEIEPIFDIFMSDIDIIKRTIFCFNPELNSPLFSLLEESENISILINNIKLQRFAYKNISQNLYRAKDKYETLSNQADKIYVSIKENTKYLYSTKYYNLYSNSIQYMESKLEIPREAFKPSINIFQRLSKSEKAVIFGIAGICALGLWCALLF